MTTIVIDLDADDLRDLIRYIEGDHHMGVYDRQKVVKQLEAAADKRVIVLDVDELKLDSSGLRKAAIHLVRMSREGAWLLEEAADALDSLAPPRPPEPTSYGALVRDGRGTVWLRVNGRDGGSVWRIDDPVTASRPWLDIPDPIEILFEGVS